MIKETPWGKEELLKTEPDMWIKILTINPLQRISLQQHSNRTEVWTIIQGKAVITLDQEEYIAKKHDTVIIPEMLPHRIYNHSKNEFLIICEVATGKPQDSDITRIQDDYDRK